MTPNHIVFIVMDSCRYDGFMAAKTPNIDRLGEAQRRYSYASWTAPSHHAFAMGMLPHASPKHVFASEVYKEEFVLWRERTGCTDIAFQTFLPDLSLPKVSGREAFAYVHESDALLAFTLNWGQKGTLSYPGKTAEAFGAGRPILVVPSDREVSMKKLAAACKGKAAEMMKPAEAERLSGYKVGGISPFGQMRKVPTLIEETALAEPYVFVNGGQRGLQVRLAPGDVLRVLGATAAGLVADTGS